MKVAVDGAKVHVYRDNVLLVTIDRRLPIRGSGGVLVANGFANLGHFRNFKIAKTRSN